MDFGEGIEHLHLAYRSILLTAGPILGIALAVGLIIGIVQAATSISENTLSFVPKLVVVLVAMGLLSSYMLSVMADQFHLVFDTIRTIR